jgi:hypothetical protein
MLKFANLYCEDYVIQGKTGKQHVFAILSLQTTKVHFVVYQRNTILILNWIFKFWFVTALSAVLNIWHMSETIACSWGVGGELKVHQDNRTTVWDWKPWPTEYKLQTPTPEAICCVYLKGKLPLLSSISLVTTLNVEAKNVFYSVFYTFLIPPRVGIPSVCRGLFVLIFLQAVKTELYKIW